MSNFEHKSGNFSLFKNEKKSSDASPDYRGEGKSLDGKDIQISAWIKDGKNGKYMSCKIQEKVSNKEHFNSNASKSNDDDSDVPF